MNTKGRLFTGVIALVLVGTACIVPLYIADKWRDVEQSGTSAVPLSSVIDTLTPNSTTVEAFEQFNKSTDVIIESPYNNAAAGTVIYFDGTNRATVDGYIEDLDGYNDILTMITTGTSLKKAIYSVHFSALNGLDHGAANIRLKCDVVEAGSEVHKLWYYYSIKFGYASDDTGANPAQLMGTNYGPTLTPSPVEDKVHWLNLSNDELNQIAAFQAGKPSNRHCLQIEIYIPIGQGSFLPSLITSWEIYQSYVEIAPGYTHSYDYDNTTVYIGSDVTVSYLDIQTWILGASGIGIGIMALAMSPYWNPLKDYKTPVPGRGRRRKR